MELDLTIRKVVAANRLYNTVMDSPIQRRCRSHWAVVLKRTGRTVYQSNGRQVLSDKTHMVLLPMGCSYSWLCEESGECLLIEFDALQTHPDVLSLPVTDSAFFEKGFLEIQRELHISTAEARLKCTYLLYGLLLQLVKREYVPRARQQLLQPALDYLADNYFDPAITNDRLAAMCGVSTVHFRKRFEAAMGMPPIRYLHALRIQKAKDILESDYGSITQVAESVGYGSVFHFSKMFRLYTGQSPTEYAKASRA